MPSEPAISKKYSLNWARQVVGQLRDAHPRATEYVLRIYGIKIINLAAYLACGDPVFNYLKKRIQYISHAIQRDNLTLTTIQTLSPEHTFIAKFAPANVQGRLDRRLIQVYARRAGSEGLVCDQSAAAGADLPSGVFQFFLFPEEMGSNGEVCQV
jgi:hypothetical protein